MIEEATHFWASIEQVARAILPKAYLGNRWIDVSVMASAFMLVMLVFTKYLGGCAAIRRVRRELMASAYEIFVYRRNVRIVLMAEMKLLWGNTKMLLCLLPSLIVGGAIFAAFYPAWCDRYAFRACRAGESVVAKVHSFNQAAQTVSGCERMDVTAEVHCDASRTTWIRLVPKQDGTVRLTESQGSLQSVAFDWDFPSRPAVPRLEHASMSVEIGYPYFDGFGGRYAWMGVFGVACGIVGIPMARVLKVSI